MSLLDQMLMYAMQNKVFCTGLPGRFLCSCFFFFTHVNFMLNISELWFLQSSRLHFIGTWRNRYRKRFPNVSIGFKSMNSNLNGHTDSQKTAIIHIDMVFFKSSNRKIRFNSDFQSSYTLGVIT